MFASSHPPKVPYPLKPYTFSFTALGPKFSKMTHQNFGPNSFCGLSTIFQGQWPNQGGAPQDPPQEATMYSTGSLLGLEMAMRKQKNGYLEAQNAFWKRQMAIWKLKMPFGSLKMNILKLKRAKAGKMQLLNPQFSKMTPPNFGPNSFCGPRTVFQGKWPNQGGGPQDPPKKRQVVAQAAGWS